MFSLNHKIISNNNIHFNLTFITIKFDELMEYVKDALNSLLKDYLEAQLVVFNLTNLNGHQINYTEYCKTIINYFSKIKFS